MVGGAALAGLVGAPSGRAGIGSLPVKVILFDAFPVYDAGGVGVMAEQLFPGKGAQLMDVWRTRQFEYTWLRNISGNYVDFFAVSSDALDYALELLGLPVAGKDSLMGELFRLSVWPDVVASLQELTRSGYRLGFLSNFTPRMLKENVERCGLGGYFSHLLSVDGVGRYKPDPRAYRMGMDAFGVRKEEVLFVASAGWDACGAKEFGYEVFWVNRKQVPGERLGASSYGVGKDLNDLVRYL